MNKKVLICRLCMSIIGIFLTGVAISIFRKAVLGVDPFNCLVTGIENISSMRFGLLFMLVQIILLMVTFFLERHYIGIGTIITMFGVGYIVEFTSFFLNMWFPDPDLLIRVVLLVIGFLILCFGGSLYMTADLGVSSYDAMALIIHDKFPKTSFRMCRIGTDFICVMIGVFFHANIGVATVGTAFCMGPLIQFFNQKVSVPLIKRYS